MSIDSPRVTSFSLHCYGTKLFKPRVSIRKSARLDISLHTLLLGGAYCMTLVILPLVLYIIDTRHRLWSVHQPISVVTFLVTAKPRVPNNNWGAWLTTNNLDGPTVQWTGDRGRPCTSGTHSVDVRNNKGYLAEFNTGGFLKHTPIRLL
jgi:hypothetical protein